MAIFAGGCFWGMEYAFSKLKGILEIAVGYSGGKTKSPIYEEVSTGTTRHYESVMISYDADVVTYKKLLEIFWKSVDPTDEKGQFLDRGSQYATAIFCSNEEQQQLAEEAKRKLEEAKIFDKPIATKILPASKFYPAEDYHQHYFLCYPTGFRIYRTLSGKMDFLKEVWQKHGDFEFFEEE